MLKEKLLEDLKSAMKDKDEIKKNTITLVRAAILQQEKDNKVEITDDKIIEIMAKEVKKRKDSLADYEKAGREDLISQINREIEIISVYLPKQLSREELTDIIKETIFTVNATSMKDMGKVMKEVKTKVGVTADGKTINEIVKELLS